MKLAEKKNNFKYLIGYLDRFIKPIVLILPWISGYIKNYKNSNNILISFHIGDDKL